MDGSYTTVDLSPEAQDLLQWARIQRQLDLNRKTLIENSPALKKAYEAIKRAEDNFDFLSKFVEDELAAELREIAP
jgi:lipopolysaccharide biosynthesis regulator YciM